MYPTILIAGRMIGTYALCGMLGLLLAGWMAVHLGKKQKVTAEDIILLLLAIAGGMFAGGHLLYALTNIRGLADAIRQREVLSWRELLQIMYHCVEGMVYYGGFFGGYAAMRFYQRCTPVLKEKQIADLYAVCTPLFHGFARIGCFFGGCCFGIPSRFGFITTNNSLNPAINGVRRFPVQLAEAAANFLIFALLYRMAKAEKRNGNMLYFYVFLYAPTRFLLEFLRGDAVRGAIWIFSTSQWISLFLLLYCGIKYHVKKKNRHPA